MKKVLIAASLAMLLAAGCNQADQTSKPTGQSQANGSSQGQSGSSQKFSDQKYYSNAYLISSASLSADAQKALNGFQMTKQTLADGSTQVVLKALNSEYRDQQYTLKPGEQLYFIERFSGDDDQGQNKDNNTGDDSAVIVDSQGNVVQGPQGWTK